VLHILRISETQFTFIGERSTRRMLSVFSSLAEAVAQAKADCLAAIQQRVRSVLLQSQQQQHQPVLAEQPERQ